jgi:hypothetical protein
VLDPLPTVAETSAAGVAVEPPPQDPWTSINKHNARAKAPLIVVGPVGFLFLANINRNYLRHASSKLRWRIIALGIIKGNRFGLGGANTRLDVKPCG